MVQVIGLVLEMTNLEMTNLHLSPVNTASVIATEIGSISLIPNLEGSYIDYVTLLVWLELFDLFMLVVGGVLMWI